jgi:hypothetical protein
MSNFYSAQNLAAYHARQADQAQQQQAEAAAAAEAQQEDFLQVVGTAMVGIVQSYADRNAQAPTDQVEQHFRQAFPAAGPDDFRQTVDTLKQRGVLYEVSEPLGFMGTRKTRLYAL